APAVGGAPSAGPVLDRGPCGGGQCTADSALPGAGQCGDHEQTCLLPSPAVRGRLPGGVLPVLRLRMVPLPRRRGARDGDLPHRPHRRGGAVQRRDHGAAVPPGTGGAAGAVWRVLRDQQRAALRRRTGGARCGDRARGRVGMVGAGRRDVPAGPVHPCGQRGPRRPFPAVTPSTVGRRRGGGVPIRATGRVQECAQARSRRRGPSQPRRRSWTATAAPSASAPRETTTAPAPTSPEASAAPQRMPPVHNPPSTARFHTTEALPAAIRCMATCSTTVWTMPTPTPISAPARHTAPAPPPSTPSTPPTARQSAPMPSDTGAPARASTSPPKPRPSALPAWTAKTTTAAPLNAVASTGRLVSPCER